MENVLSRLRVEVESHVLGNGLRVVVQPDPAAPLVAVHTMYHVGSRHERPGRTGLAHLLEHLLFEGTEHCPKGEYDRLLEEVGGSNNGSTWLDRTNYYETVPPHAVELALWLERERLAHFLPLLDERMLELQRGVVMNERLQSYENRPYGMADERLQQLLFAADHPYSWPTIGYMDDLRAMTLEDARSFYERYYTPANAVLVLCGAIEPGRAVELAERYLGDVNGAATTSPNGSVPPLAAPGEDVLEDRVSFDRIYRAHAVPAYGTRDWVALDVLGYVLTDGDSSRLQESIIRERQLAQDVDAFLYPTELHGVFGIVATARTGVPAKALHDAVEAEVTRVAEEGVGEEELAGALRRVRRDQLAALANVEDRAEELAYAATVLGSAPELERVLNSYVELEPEDVRAAAERHLGSGARLSVVPERGGHR